MLDILIGLLLFFAHIFGCGFYLIGKIEDNYDIQDNWLTT